MTNNNKVVTNQNKFSLNTLVAVPPKAGGKINANTFKLVDNIEEVLKANPLGGQARVLVLTLAKLGGKATKSQLQAELLKNNKSGVEHYDLKSTPTNVDKVLGHYVKQLGSLGKWSSGTNPAPKYWEVS